MFNFFNKFKRNRVWSIALYTKGVDFSFSHKFPDPWLVLNSKKLRSSKGHVHTYADPFLFPYDGELYMFFESQAVSEPGKIEAIKTSDLKTFEYLGEILKEPFHLSFPFVFQDGEDIYLMPESYATEEIALYKSIPDHVQPKTFPKKLHSLSIWEETL